MFVAFHKNVDLLVNNNYNKNKPKWYCCINAKKAHADKGTLDCLLTNSWK